MKRIICIGLLAALLLGMIPAASAATPTFAVSTAEAAVGDTVDLTVSIANNPGIIGFRLMVAYDDAALELLSTQAGKWSGMVFGPLTKNPLVMTWVDGLNPDNTTNGAVATLRFRVREDAPSGLTPVTVTYGVDDVINAAFENVTFATQKGGITIKGGSAAAEPTRYSVTELDDADRGLAFRFTVPVGGATIRNGHTARLNGAYVMYNGEKCALVQMGALLTADANKSGTAALVRGGSGVTDVPTTSLLEADTDTCSFALRVLRIPDSAAGRTVYARPYYVVRYQGKDVTVYGAVASASYRALR